MQPDYVQRILTARVAGGAVETPLEPVSRLSARLGNRILLKREDLQPIFSFKIRGAMNKLQHIAPEVRARGVLASSAGNHAQGVALAAARLGCPATIVMPVTTPAIKVDAVRSLGGHVVLHGDSYSDAEVLARELEQEQGLAFVHPYDDPDVIAGQGTIALEIVRQAAPLPRAIFVPVGGGGLLAGMAAFIKQVAPEIRMVGVEPEDADAMYRSCRAGRRIRLDAVGLFADGVAVRQVGRETFRLCRAWVDEILRVDTDAICAAIKDVFEDTRTILEPAGALGVAGLKQFVHRGGLRDQPLVAVASGANLNFNRLRHISERAEIGDHTEALLAVTIPERPGSFRAFCATLGDRSVTEFNYRFASPDCAHVFVGLQVSGRDETRALVADLNGRGLPAVDLGDNELAKLHTRYMVGGRAPQVEHEQLYRFEFPERPGALRRFLDAMRHGWNISLFHYRNFGADVGRVLVGIQVPPADRRAFADFLRQVGYACHRETNNPAYQLFLK